MNIDETLAYPAQNHTREVTVPEGAENIAFYAVEYDLARSGPRVIYGGEAHDIPRDPRIPHKIWSLRELEFYDDCSGDFYIAVNSISWDGLIRADSWEAAYDIWRDELAADGEEPTEEEQVEGSHEEACWDEANGYRSNGIPASNRLKSNIYAKDLNGENILPLTYEGLLSIVTYGVEIHYTLPAEKGECDIQVAERYEKGYRQAMVDRRVVSADTSVHGILMVACGLAWGPRVSIAP